MPLFFKKKQKTKCGEGCKNAEFTLLFVNYTPIKLKDFITTRQDLQETLKGVLQTEMKGN